MVERGWLEKAKDIHFTFITLELFQGTKAARVLGPADKGRSLYQGSRE